MANDENEILNNLFAKLPIRQTPWQYVGARNKSHQRDYLKFDDAINHFIKTSEYDESRRSYIDESEVGHGFYLMDYGQYSEILSKFNIFNRYFFNTLNLIYSKIYIRSICQTCK